MSLDFWQEKIYEHFNFLDDYRSDTESKNPIFALEHGLSDSELNALKADIQTHIVKSEPTDHHWLPWVVYAAEVGYTYDGQEYWQTFESNTPGWTRSRDRNRYWMRECFIKFQKTFHGAKPAGPWAEHFANICWPIRHAILPHFLQHHLARALFDLRLSFRGEHFESPLILGNFIATHCRSGPKRFRELLEDPMLVGQFCTALLLHDNKISEDLLLKETQLRIVADLGREQRARSWLEGAQKQAITTFKGLHQHRTGKVNPHEIDTRLDEERFRIENKPNIILYPLSNRKEYGVKLELQDLRAIAECFRDYEPIIANRFCTINGTNGFPFPKGMFLKPGPHPIFPLCRWPSSTETLIKFEDAPPELDLLLSMNRFIPSGDLYLFKISSDCNGYEIYEKNLRPNQKYIIVSSSPIKLDGVILKPFTLKCEGVYSALIETPDEIASHFRDEVKKIGLNCVKSLRVWPVGLPAKEWDDEGYGVWLAGDCIRVAIKADYELRGLEITINEDDSYFIDAPESNDGPVLLEMPPLSYGDNLIEIKAIAKYQPHDDHLVGYLTAIVREPQVWSADAASQGILRGFVYPENPSMEEIWANNISIEIYGPVGKNIGCKVRLLDSTNIGTVKEKIIATLKLPLLQEQWRHKFATSIKNDELIQEAYDESNVCELVFDAEEMGHFKVSSERKYTPIRWAIHKSGNHKKLRYINETEDSDVKISRYEFSVPDIPEILKIVKKDQIVECDKGGLFVIQGVDNISDAIIISPHGHKMSSFRDMKIFPKLQKSYVKADEIWQLIILYNWWEGGRTSGDILSDLWCKQVLMTILSNMCQFAGGSKWEKAERDHLEKSDNNSLYGLKICISDRQDERYIGAVLEREAKNMAALSVIERKNILEKLFNKQIRGIVQKDHIDHHSKGGIIIRKAPAYLLSEFVLRLSSAPNTLINWEKEKFLILMKYLQQVPVIFRAARYLVLAIENHLASKYTFNDYYRRWDWQ